MPQAVLNILLYEIEAPELVGTGLVVFVLASVAWSLLPVFDRGAWPDREERRRRKAEVAYWASYLEHRRAHARGGGSGDDTGSGDGGDCGGGE